MKKLHFLIVLFSIISMSSCKGAKGDQGIQGETGPQGNQGIQGETGPQGNQGETGIGVEKIEKTSSNGLIDTYTIYYTDGSTSTFDVKNGETGPQGVSGADGSVWFNGNGKPTIIGKNGDYYIDIDTSDIYIYSDDGWIVIGNIKGNPGLDSPNYGKTYEVTLDVNGGILPEGYIEVVEVEYGESINLPLPIMDGYLFEGWYTGNTVNDEKITNYTIINQNMTLYASWKNMDYELKVFEDAAYINKYLGQGKLNIEMPSYVYVGIEKYELKGIYSNAFTNCAGFNYIVIPKNIEIVEKGAFEECSNVAIYCEASSKPEGWDEEWCDNTCVVYWNSTITDVEIEEKSVITHNNIIYKFYMNSFYVGGYTDELIEAEVVSFINGYSVTSIGVNAFSNCEKLKSVKIPIGVTKIYNSAFSNCVNLESILLPEGLIYIGESAFSNCEKLEDIEIPDGIITLEHNTFWCCYSLKNVILPNDLTTIGQSVFTNCWSIKYNEYENGKYIGSKVNPYLLLRGTISKDFTDFKINENTRHIYDSVFSEIATLENIKFPKELISIGTDAFFKCKNLKSVELSEGLTIIKDRAFYNCYSLEKVSIPSTLKSIGLAAFRECNNLSSIVIPSSVEVIKSEAFYYCTKLNIYIEVTSTPEGWKDDWQYGVKNIYWGNYWKLVEGVPTPK